MTRLLPSLFALFFFASVSLPAQNAPHLRGEILASLAEGTDGVALGLRADPSGRAQKVCKMLNIWLFRTHLPEEETLRWFRQQPEVRAAQFNHVLENRSSLSNLLPNDPLFPQQWHHLNDGSSGGVFDADMDSEQAWEITRGGVSPAGDTVVIAVIDSGLDAAHPDLLGNLWRNWAEIPQNGLDDDQNGFTDDYRGWNVFTENDAIEGLTTGHGTPVSAVLGARGDNGVGVTGVNWATKILFVSAAGTEAEVLAAYDYVWQARQRYNVTAGQKGAFVVALNCSWGVNFGQPSEAPLWCAAFDEMGASGILSVAATANLPINVDEVGDLPTACPSNFLIGVTSLDRKDEKAANAAWGVTHVDLGAYGQEVYTAATGGGYGYFSGTSYAAPQVAGAIGLLYTAPCPNLIALSKIDPASAAYWAKSLVLENVTPNPALTGRTFSDGRLNLYKTLLNYEQQCSNCPAPFALKTESLTDTSTRLVWTKPLTASTVNLRWRRLGVGIWSVLEQVSDPFHLSGLSVCTEYEFEMQSVCENGLSSAWSQPLIFETKGCCVAPASIWLENVGEHFAQIGWEASSFNNTYRIRLRQSGGTGWQILDANTNGWVFQELAPCTEYELQVQARCEEWLTNYSTLFSFKTLGCGACNELAYCPIMGASAAVEWIASVQIGNWINESGLGGNGYQNFAANQSVLPPLVSEQVVPVRVTPGFLGGIGKEYFRIYVDFNQDGDFDDDHELAFDPGFALEGPAEGYIQVPPVAMPGITRMRVMMKYTTPNDNPPGACTPFDFGQVEDYCAELRLDSFPTSTASQDTVWVLRAFPQPAKDWVILEFPKNLSQRDCAVQIWDQRGQTILQKDLPILRNNRIFIDTIHWPSGIYAIQVRCGGQVMRGKIVL